MLEAIIAGERGPKALAQLARGTMRGKIHQLEEALDCSFLTEEHVAILTMMLAAIDSFTTHRRAHRPDRGARRALPAPDRAARRRARHRDHQRPGRHRRNRRGHDRLPHRPHLVSWARWCPQVSQSGGKRKGSNATGRGNPYLSAALGEISIGAGRTHSFPGARYRRLVRRMPKKKALVATGNSILTIFHACSQTPAPPTRTSAPATTD